MESKPSRKRYSFKLVKPYKSRLDKSVVSNQSTLLGSLFKLMMNEKIITALVKVKDYGQKTRTVPVCFKMDSILVPNDFTNFKIKKSNLINISIFDSKPVPALIVIVSGK